MGRDCASELVPIALAEGQPEGPPGEGISGECPCRPFRLRDDERPP
jgi:hypothetical protein